MSAGNWAQGYNKMTWLHSRLLIDDLFAHELQMKSPKKVFTQNLSLWFLLLQHFIVANNCFWCSLSRCSNDCGAVLPDRPGAGALTLRDGHIIGGSVHPGPGPPRQLHQTQPPQQQQPPHYTQSDDVTARQHQRGDVAGSDATGHSAGHGGRRRHCTFQVQLQYADASQVTPRVGHPILWLVLRLDTEQSLAHHKGSFILKRKNIFFLDLCRSLM